MKKTMVSAIFLVSIILLMSSSNILAINEGAPVWALDPTKDAQYLADYDLLYANNNFSTDFSGLGSYGSSIQVNISGWFQVWGGPKGCAPGSCAVIVAISYIETSFKIPDIAFPYLKNIFASAPGFEDITSQVPNAALAYMYNGSGGFYFGMAYLNTGSNFIMTIQYNSSAWVTPSSSGDSKSSLKLSSASGEQATKDLLIAAGNAAGVLNGIPGYDLLIFLGVSGIISAGIILKKKKHL